MTLKHYNMTEKERMKLAPHFILYEMTRSGTATEYDLPNTPNNVQISALKALATHILEPLRKRFGPIVISSGFRSPKVNMLVGGVPISQHTKGEAADIVIGTPERGLRMFKYIKENLDFDQLIWEPRGSQSPRWLHVSYCRTRKNRHQVLR
jgi:zinc D-Ala-D-Ala carboxypeptidase